MTRLGWLWRYYMHRDLHESERHAWRAFEAFEDVWDALQRTNVEPVKP